MKDLQGVKLTFEKTAFAAYGPGERKILYVFAAISNRLRLLLTQSFGHWATARNEARSEHARSAALCGIVESLIDLAGELKEAHESINQCYHGTQVSKSLHPQLPAIVQEALKRLPRHFGGAGLVTYLRNNFASHNNSDELLQIADHLDNQAEHTFFYFSGENKYFEYATKARLSAIALHLQLTQWTWDSVIAKMVEIIVKDVYTDVFTALNGILAQLLAGMSLQREVAIAKDIRTFSELAAEYYLFIESATVQ